MDNSRDDDSTEQYKREPGSAIEEWDQVRLELERQKVERRHYIVNRYYPLLPANPRESVRRNPNIAPAWIGGILALLGALGGASATIYADAPPECIAVIQGYESFVGNNPKQIELLIIPGSDGKSILSADRAAAECGLDEDTLRRLAEP